MKELKKMNLSELKSLSRKEMKNIMAGSGDIGCGTGCVGTCDGGPGTYGGKCVWSYQNWTCYCSSIGV